MFRVAVAVFVKTPSLSPVKTRLGATIGKGRSEEFYRLSVAAVREQVGRLAERHSNITPYFAVAEEEGLSDPLWAGWRVVQQGTQGLGERLATVWHALSATHDCVIVIGADSPQLGVSRYEEALAAIVEPSLPRQVVVGPALDGGFYLVGGRADLTQRVWGDIRYSTEHACHDLTERLRATGYSVVNLPVERDIDTEEDLFALAPELRHRLLESGDSPSWKALLRWLER